MQASRALGSTVAEMLGLEKRVEELGKRRD
jgi:hypothetical protein